MRILVTGACGYVGSAVVPRLIAAGWDVLATDPASGADGRAVRYQDAACRRMAGVVDAVLHLAGHSTVAACAADPTAALANNVTDFLAFAAALPAAVPLLYASSASVYGVARDARASDPLPAPLAAYDAHKQAIDLLTRHAHPLSYGLRFGTVTGPAPRTRATAVNAMCRAAAAGLAVLSGPAGVCRSFLGVRDLGDAVLRLLAVRPAPGAYNLASFAGTFGGVGQLVAARAGVPWKPLAAGDSPYDFTVGCHKAVAAGCEFLETAESAVDGLLTYYRSVPCPP